MSTIEFASKTGTNAVRRLREQKLRAGLPFMINDTALSTDQCYLEYPDGNIELVSTTSSALDFTIIRKLTYTEAEELRNQYQFTRIA